MELCYVVVDLVAIINNLHVDVICARFEDANFHWKLSGTSQELGSSEKRFI